MPIRKFCIFIIKIIPSQFFGREMIVFTVSTCMMTTSIKNCFDVHIRFVVYRTRRLISASTNTRNKVYFLTIELINNKLNSINSG